MIQIKCDRCGVIVEGKPHMRMTFAGRTSEDKYDDAMRHQQFDLCDRCWRDVMVAIDTPPDDSGPEDTATSAGDLEDLRNVAGMTLSGVEKTIDGINEIERYILQLTADVKFLGKDVEETHLNKIMMDAVKTVMPEPLTQDDLAKMIVVLQKTLPKPLTREEVTDIVSTVANPTDAKAITKAVRDAVYDLLDADGIAKAVRDAMPEPLLVADVVKAIQSSGLVLTQKDITDAVAKALGENGTTKASDISTPPPKRVDAGRIVALRDSGWSLVEIASDMHISIGEVVTALEEAKERERQLVGGEDEE